MFRIHIQGLSLCVLSDERLTVLMLNSGFPRKQPTVPYHIPSLFVPEELVRANTIPRLASIVGRWSPPKTAAPSLYGWSLSGLKLRIGAGSTPERPPTSSAVEQMTHPDPNNIDWRDLHWVLSANKMLPKAPLRDEFRTLGVNTTAIVELRGGRLEGGDPFSISGSKFEWVIRDGYAQAFTDTIDVVYDTAPSMLALDCDDREVGGIDLAPAGDAWLVNESPDRMKRLLDLQTDLRACDDGLIYLEAFDASKEEKDAVVFQRGQPWRDLVTTGDACDGLLFDERTRK